MSYSKILLHIVFRTKYSEPTLDLSYTPELFKYIWGVIKNKKGVLYRINCMEDHVHIVLSLPHTISLSDYIKAIKVSSSLWIKSSGLFPRFKSWGEGFCALSYSYQDKDTLVQYVKNQQEHHKKENFRDEIIRLFKEQGEVLDERFFDDKDEFNPLRG
ncbi:IS200/IS605 family transposase [Bacteroides sp. 519]|uniref:IS200/IS605 family transposase n=1 Tax=Bacteroides sp. 519 TaxID=2302937 RepID=UPI0013D6A4EE|nr:IS200/IS605 family transposase [Bacteroides sp. 519]NDV57929.1 IS200/IS605 family transposase [Bacteroides sp. 519]